MINVIFESNGDGTCHIKVKNNFDEIEEIEVKQVATQIYNLICETLEKNQIKKSKTKKSK